MLRYGRWPSVLQLGCMGAGSRIGVFIGAEEGRRGRRGTGFPFPRPVEKSLSRGGLFPFSMSLDVG